MTREDAYSFACQWAWISPHAVRGFTVPEQAAGRNMLQYFELVRCAPLLLALCLAVLDSRDVGARVRLV